MQWIKDFESDGKGCVLRCTYGANVLLGAIANGVLLIPWTICYYYFIYKEDWRDPYHCWVVDGDYRAYATAPGILGEEDIG